MINEVEARPLRIDRELEQLKAGGYQQTGDYLLPPTH
jgi:hypothetical protein